MKLRSIFAWFAALTMLVSWPEAVSAQDSYESAPPADSTGPTGVSYGTGGFTYDLPALSIGAGDFPQSLGLMYKYRSDGARAPNTPWTTNMAVRTSQTRTDPVLEQGCPPYCNPGDYTWTWNIVVGHRSGGFYKVGAGAGPGPYTPQQLDGSSLTWTSTGTGTGKFIYTSGDGAQIVFASMPTNGTSHATPESWKEPDGTTITYAANSVSTNRGVAIYFETPTGSGTTTQKVCALNLTVYYLPNVTSCPSGVPTVTVVRQGERITSITSATGGVTNFTYGALSGNGSDGHLTCVKEPGQSACTIQNVYDNCDVAGTGDYYDPEANGSRDRVISQTLATGETVGYSYVSAALGPGPITACRGNASATMTQGGSAVTEVDLGPPTLPGSVEDPLDRVSTMTWVGPGADFSELTRLKTYTTPEGTIVEYTYDGRGNITQTRRKAKSGSGLADIVTSATYPASCSNIFTCNKPLTTIDAKGSTTTYTYHSSHGGVLTESGPAVGGVSPRKKYTYAQRYAWIKNASSGYSQASSPVWVLTEERTCRTSTLDLSAGTCSAGSGDLVTTAYDYGPNSGPNNLWLRGVAVTADGQTLRTCYGYDGYGRKISETAPNANLTSCP
jgi:YD repeat-containing protein